MNICVYGASSDQIDKIYIDAVEKLGEKMAKRGHDLVFGGGDSGLMGAAARGVHRGGGKVLGIAPSFFNVDGRLYEKCDEFIYPDTMRERKRILEQRSEGFIVTPGGIGTFDEFFEMITLRQLGRHNKPIAVFNVNGYYDAMLAMLKCASDRHFMKPLGDELFRVFDNDDEILEFLENYSGAPLELKNLKYV